jgi:hypothetical protein
MRRSTFARKPPGKRGVSKATMDAPQEEFITGEANASKSKASTNETGQRRKHPSKSQDSRP